MERSLNIALLSIHSCPFAQLGSRDTGGMNVYIREICGELAAQGHRIDIFTAAHRCGHCFILRADQGIRLHHLKSRLADSISRTSFDTYISSLAEEICQMQKENANRYDLIHSHYWQSGILGNTLQERWKIPHLTMFHTLSAVKKTLHLPNNDPDFRLTVEREAARHCNRIIASTDKEKEYLSHFYNAPEQKIATIPCGVNLKIFQPLDQENARDRLGLTGNEKTILYVGRLEPLKGIEQLLRAFVQIQAKCPARLLILGGDGPDSNYLSHLKEMSKDLNIHQHTNFMGSVAQTDLPLYYSAADTCVISSYYESFCLVLLESLACGTPVITANIGIADKIVNHPSLGMVLDCNHSQIIADKTIELIRRHEKTTINIEACRASVSAYNWADIATKIHSEYMHLATMPLAADIAA
jgi:D-inositol-3-phosphate glycosyltransferase